MKRTQLPPLLALCLLAALNASAAVHYVDVNSATPVAPYLSWATAARNIQDAIDAAGPGEQILVNDGVYQAGGKVLGSITNRVAVNKPVSVASVNGPQSTVIQGYQVPGTTNGDGAIRCVYLASGGSLSGFTLTQGATQPSGEQSGGGVWCADASAVVSNCVIVTNAAYSLGGGAYSGTLLNCTLAGNAV